MDTPCDMRELQYSFAWLMNSWIERMPKHLFNFTMRVFLSAASLRVGYDRVRNISEALNHNVPTRQWVHRPNRLIPAINDFALDRSGDRLPGPGFPERTRTRQTITLSSLLLSHWTIVPGLIRSNHIKGVRRHVADRGRSSKPIKRK
jgi:predicted oxidoreductase